MKLPQLPQDSIWLPVISLVLTCVYRPQSHLHNHIHRPLFALCFNSFMATSLPDLRPFMFLTFLFDDNSLAKQPQELVFSFKRFFDETFLILPHSHLHSHKGGFFDPSTNLITSRRPNFRPIKLSFR